MRGNHDDDVASLDPEVAQVLGRVNFNGMGWIASTPLTVLARIQKALSQLPIAMEIQTSRGLVGLVHGDIPAGMSWQEFTAAIELGDPEVIETALQGRARIKSGDARGVPGVGRVFVGHSVQWEGPQRLGNVYAIDTGAVFRDLKKFGTGSLSMVDVVCATEVLGPRIGTPLSPVEIYDKPANPDEAFGCYTRSRA